MNTIEPDRRIFLNLWVSGEAHTSGFFTYQGKWACRLHIRHATSIMLMRRLQEAGVLITSTHESSQIREWKNIDIGVDLDTGTKTPVVEREINGMIAFRFNKMVGRGGATFDVEYKGKKVSSGFVDAIAEPPVKLFRRFRKMGVKFYASPLVRKMLEDYLYDFGIEWDQEDRRLF